MDVDRVINISDAVSGRVRGRVQIAFFENPKNVPLEAFCLDEMGWLDLGHNSINDTSEDIFRGLLARDLENKMLETISVGDGGDLDTTPVHADTGARVPPDPAETEMRSVVEGVPILITNVNGSDVTLTALARPEQANSDDINEFGLLSKDGTMFAHFVTEEVAPGGRARKYPKKSWHYLAIRWTITYDNS
jgi:hypothetical protein